MKMHLCSCKVNLSGQNVTIVHINEFDPVSWPEVQVLQLLHGEENVFDIKPVKITEVNHRMEKDRLAIKYGYKPVEQIFPGRNPRIEMLMPGETEGQPQVDDLGHAVEGNGEPPKPEPDDDEDDAAVKPPTDGPPVFKPGRHPRPVPAT
jgi:hypothetical protein